MEPLAKKSLLWVTVALLLFILISAARFGAAELFSMSANRGLDELQSAGNLSSGAQVEAVASQFEIARFLADSVPSHHEDIARLSEWRAKFPDASPVEKRMQLLAGLTEIRTVIRLEPVSPYSWASLLMFKRELGEFDAEFRHALHRAVELGPWEPGVITILADVGLSAWPEMPVAEQALIQQVFVRGMEHQSDQMLDIVRAFQSKCAFLAEADKQKAGCQ